MDLIYANEEMEDLGVLLDYTFDLAIGADENNFELTVDSGSHVCQAGYFLYIEGTEYGGVVDAIRVRTASNEITYKGRTWQGILASKVIEPDEGQDYLTVSGDANEVIAVLLERLGLDMLYTVPEALSGITIHSYKMNRYIDGYAGIVKMLAAAGGKLRFVFRDAHVLLSAEAAVDYSKDEQFDSDQVEFDIEKGFRPINHVICLGRGDLAEREVIHLYADQYGMVGHVQELAGIHEVTGKYEKSNAESYEELEQGGINLLQEAYAAASKVSMSFANEGTVYDIGDIVGARENITGIEAAERIVKKIVTIDRGKIDIEYKVGG